MDPKMLIYLWVGLGVLARVILPYLNTMREGKLPTWEAKYLLPPIMSIVISVITLPLVLETLPAETVSQFAAFAFGWAEADISRFLQKFLAGAVSY